LGREKIVREIVAMMATKRRERHIETAMMRMRGKGSDQQLQEDECVGVIFARRSL